MKIKAILVINCMLYISQGIQASPFQTDSLRFEKYLSLSAKRLDSAEFYFDKAEAFANTPSLMLKLNRMKGWYLFDLAKYDSAIAYVKMISEDTTNQTDSFQKENAQCFYLLRTLYIATNDYHAAIEAGHQSVKIQESIGATDGGVYPSTLINLAIDYWRVKKFTKAIEWLDKAHVNLRSNSCRDLDLRISTFITFGLVYVGLNDLPLAKEYYMQAFDLIATDRQENIRDYMATCNNLAIVYTELEQYDSALSYYNKALQVLDEGSIPQRHKYLIPRYLGYTLANIGGVHHHKKEYKKSIEFHQRSLKVQIDNAGMDNPDLLGAYTGLAKGQMRMNQWGEAEKSIRKGLHIARKNDIYVSWFYNHYGELHFLKEDFAEADRYYDSAIAAHKTSINYGEKIYEHPDVILDSFKGKALTNSQLNGDPYMTIEWYEKTKELIRFLYSRTNDLSIFREINSLLDAYYIEFSALYDQSQDQKWLALMWEISEMSKGANLKKQLRNNYSLSYAIPKALHQRVIELQDSISMAIGKVEPNKPDTTLFILSRKLDKLTHQLERDYPNYFRLKNTLVIGSLANRMQEIAEDELLLNFYQGEEKVHLISMRKGRMTAYSIEMKVIEAWITKLNDALISNDRETIDDLSVKIRDTLHLTTDSLAHIKYLTVLPDGDIWSLNFAALSSWDDSSFLGSELAIRYEYSSQASETNANSVYQKVLAFSFNELAEESAKTSYLRFRDLELNKSLPGASEEISAISNIWDGDYYFSKEASEHNFKQQSKSYSILHLALHGFQDENWPENSFLKFNSADSVEDGRLHAYELYNMNLNAELAVLSACHSGKGKVVEGEGMKSIAHAFSYAGVRSTLGSRWLVPDSSSPYIMKYFYDGLMKGMRKSEALQFAQNEYLANDADNITSAPLYWAGFYIIGNDNPIKQGKNSGWSIYLSLGLLIVISILAMNYKKRASGAV